MGVDLVFKRFGVLNRKKGGAKQDFAACA
jgi:hypothetical protein